MDEFALCLGISLADVHFLRLDDPICVSTRRYKQGEEYIVGKWYRKQGRHYQLTEDLIQTNLIRKISLDGGEKTTLELVLPVFFPPDLADLQSGFGHSLEFNDPNYMHIPICPLFGPEGTECLPSVKLSQGPVSNIYSNELYALKTNLSYKVGETPEWIPLNTRQLKPWNHNEWTIIRQLCMESRIEALSISYQMSNMRNIHFNILLDKQGELMVAVLPESKKIIPGEYRLFWPIKLAKIYKSEVVIALDCPQNGHRIDSELVLQKYANEKFNITWKTNPFSSTAHSSCYSIPWLGKMMDPFSLINNNSAYGHKSFTVKAHCHLNMDKRSAVWVVESTIVGSEDGMAIISQRNIPTNAIIDNSRKISPTLSSSSETTSTEELKNIPKMANGQLSISSATVAVANTRSSSTNKCEEISPFMSTLNLALDNPSEDMKTAIAAFMAKGMGNEAVFLFWDPITAKFTCKYYAMFYKSLKFNMGEYGKWFELKYVNHSQSTIFIFDYSATEKRAVTRVRDGVSAQFSTNRERFLSVWHAKFPCEEKSNYYEDKGWWPWLCRKCFPGLRELSPPTIQEKPQIKGSIKEEDMSIALEDFNQKIGASFAQEDANSESSGKHSFESFSQADKEVMKHCEMSKHEIEQTRYNLVVLLAVRSCGDSASVFLLFDEEKRIFTSRIYAPPPKMIAGKPEIGKWYRIEQKTYTSTTGQKINLKSVGTPISNPPIQTRVKDGILAQFNSKSKLMLVWHKAVELHPYQQLNQYDHHWWPQLCSVCYPAPAQAESESSSLTSSAATVTQSHPPPASVMNLAQNGAYTSKFVTGTGSNSSSITAEIKNNKMPASSLSNGPSKSSELNIHTGSSRPLIPQSRPPPASVLNLAQSGAYTSKFVCGTGSNASTITTDKTNLKKIPSPLSSNGLPETKTGINTESSSSCSSPVPRSRLPPTSVLNLAQSGAYTSNFICGKGSNASSVTTVANIKKVATGNPPPLSSSGHSKASESGISTGSSSSSPIPRSRPPPAPLNDFYRQSENRSLNLSTCTSRGSKTELTPNNNAAHQLKAYETELNITSQELFQTKSDLTSSDLENSTKENLAVFLTVHNDSGNSVFLLFNGIEGKFTHQVYAAPPEWISGNPEVGKWYKMDANLNINSLENGETIELPSVDVAMENPPIESRMKDGILAQFNTAVRFLEVWHKNDDCLTSPTGNDGPWWPELCPSCYPQQIESILRQDPIQGEGAKETPKTHQSKKNKYMKSTAEFKYSDEEDNDRDESSDIISKNIQISKESNHHEEYAPSSPSHPPPDPITLTHNGIGAISNLPISETDNTSTLVTAELHNQIPPVLHSNDNGTPEKKPGIHKSCSSSPVPRSRPPPAPLNGFYRNSEVPSPNSSMRAIPIREAQTESTSNIVTKFLTLFTNKTK